MSELRLLWADFYDALFGQINTAQYQMLSTIDDATLLATPLPTNFAMTEAHISLAWSFDLWHVEGWFIRSRSISEASCEVCSLKSDWCGVCTFISLFGPMLTVLWQLFKCFQKPAVNTLLGHTKQQSFCQDITHEKPAVELMHLVHHATNYDTWNLLNMALSS